ncbi:MAG: RnfABCDGE type electron transport complex subunit D [Treponema sp.]|nr:RnfABCDGE type electron transport complex subunit D [Treponema sp.]
MTYYQGLADRVTFRPYSFLSPSVADSSLGLLILLLVQVVLLAITRSFNSLLLVSLTTLSALGADIVNSILRQHFERSWRIAIVQGIIVGLLLPSTYSPVAAVIITFCVLLLSKYAFGGFSGPWVNPVAITVAVAYFLDMSAFPLLQIDSSMLQNRNAALLLIQDGSVPIASEDAYFTAFMNRTIFSVFKLAVPEGYVSLFWDTGSLIPAFRFNAITLISSIILISLDMVDWIIPACFMTVYAVLVRLCGPLVTGAIPMQGDMLLALLTGGTLFVALYVLQWYGTTPATAGGKCVYGCIAGLFAFLIMGMGTSPVGCMFVVLAMNIVSPIIQYREDLSVFKTVHKQLIPRINAMKEVDRVGDD